MANAILDGAGKALGLPAAGAIIAALAGQLYLWSFGPYGWTREVPVCPQVETCVVVAGLNGDVNYGFGAGGNVFGVDMDDDVTERLVSRLGLAAPHDRPGAVSFLKYTREVSLPEAGDAREQDAFFGSLARAREIGINSRARIVVMGRVVGDDVIIWFVDPNSEEAPQQADYSMTAPDAQQSLARSFNEALTNVVRAEQQRAQATAERERLAQQQQQQQQQQQARTQVASNSAPRQVRAPPTQVAPAPPVTAPSSAPGARAPPPTQTAASSSPGVRTPPQTPAPTTPAPATRPPQQQAQPVRPAPASTQAPAPPPAAQTAVAMPNGPFVYYCTDDRVLRVVFDSERRTATVTQYGRAPSRLQLETGGSSFRFARGGYDLSGTITEVRWRIGSADPLVCTRRSW